MIPLIERLQQQRQAARRPQTLLLLDGATGTELQRRGVDTRLPLWSAAALVSHPEVVRAIHADYVAAGAEIVTANTFRTHGRNVVAGGLAAEAATELTELAVRLAREAARGRAYVVGSQAPLEDCYSPQLVPDPATLKREHRAMSGQLAAAGVDGILVETQNTTVEAVAAASAASATGLPTLVSFICGEDAKLMSGESLRAAVEAVLAAARPAALLVNCGPAPAMLAALGQLQAAAGQLPLGVYANIGYPDSQQGWINTDAQHPAAYAEYAAQWLAAGATLVGGCCGTTPAHIAELRRRFAFRPD